MNNIQVETHIFQRADGAGLVIIRQIRHFVCLFAKADRNLNDILFSLWTFLCAAVLRRLFDDHIFVIFVAELTAYGFNGVFFADLLICHGLFYRHSNYFGNDEFCLAASGKAGEDHAEENDDHHHCRSDRCNHRPFGALVPAASVLPLVIFVVLIFVIAARIVSVVSGLSALRPCIVRMYLVHL